MPSDLPVWATVRLADRGDVPHLHRMVKELAETQRLAHSFSATEATLSRVLFPDDDPLPPFKSFTVLILEVSSSARAEAEHHPPEAEGVHPRPTFDPITRRLDPGDAPISDPEAGAFSRGGAGGGAAAVVAGFVLFFPSLSTFLAKPGFHVEDLFVRAAYRRRGVGRMLLSAVAAQAARMGLGRVEWSVLDWNANAIKFYEDMGAEVLPRWRICRLHGDALRSYI